ncbi:DNA-3-methyladenine glycosylase [Candidatus Parcubacteria bacterium]|nr:DNA-3-methyladenine glycosylase [Candidatus Parcubacteria bacterium]
MALDRRFYLDDAALVARRLLGKLLVNEVDGRMSAGKIVETEAYLGSRDPASHAFRGQTPRNAVMFGPAGRAYIYFTYGLHYCFNVVAGPVGVAEAVLIRALEPVEGVELMMRRRGQTDRRQLCSGPAKLVQALGITQLQNGADITRGPLYISQLDQPSDDQIIAAPRIGITRATDRPLRFLIKDSPFVSKPPRRNV